MAMMGHSRAAMTLHYTMADPERHRVGMEGIMAAILPAAGESVTRENKRNALLQRPSHY